MNRRMFLQTAALGWSLGLPFAAGAEDWPQWRGPNRDGVWNETGIRETFPTNELEVCWPRRGPGTCQVSGHLRGWRAPVGYGFSSPVVAQGRVFVADSQLARPKVREWVLCFDEATGRPLWTNSHEATFPDWAFTPGQEQGPNATPMVRDGKVYALGPLGHRLFCVEAGKGGLLWQKNLANVYQNVLGQAVRDSPAPRR